MGPVRRLISHGLIYGLASVASSLASFVLTPIYARCLGPAAYGQLEMILALVQVVTILSACGAASSSLALIIQPAGEPPAVAGSAASVVTACGMFWLLGIFAAAPWIGAHLHLPVTEIRLVGVAGFLTALAQIPFALWRARGQAWLLAGFSVAQVLLTLGLNVHQVVWLHHGALGILTGLIMAQGTIAAAGLWWTRRQWLSGWRWDSARPIVTIGVFHVVNSLATWTVQLADRFLLAAVVSPPELGCYTLGNKVSGLASLALASPLALAWPSYLAQFGRDPAAAKQYAPLFEGAAAYASGLYLVISLPASMWIHLFGGSAYAAAGSLVPILALAFLISGLQPILISGMALSMNFRYLPILAIGSALLNVGLNLWWIPRWGATGAAWATLLAYTGAAVAGRYYAQRLRPLSVTWSRIGAYAMWAAGLYAAGQVSESPVWHGLLILFYAIGALWQYGRRAKPSAVPVDPELQQAA